MGKIERWLYFQSIWTKIVTEFSGKNSRKKRKEINIYNERNYNWYVHITWHEHSCTNYFCQHCDRIRRIRLIMMNDHLLLNWNNSEINVHIYIFFIWFRSEFSDLWCDLCQNQLIGSIWDMVQLKFFLPQTMIKCPHKEYGYTCLGKMLSIDYILNKIYWSSEMIENKCNILIFVTGCLMKKKIHNQQF